MTRIALITTGMLEYQHLGTSLQKVFPDVEFISHYADSITSSRMKRLDPNAELPLATQAYRLAGKLVEEVLQGRDVRSSKRSDFAIVIDDLELENLDQPAVVVEIFHQAVEKYLLDRRWTGHPQESKARNKILESCSFHLLVPMLESYFFGDTAALTSLGLTPPLQLQPGRDLEAFSVIDEAYLATATETRGREFLSSHPKHYLKHLLATGGYRETRQGAWALQSLNWLTVLQATPQVRFLRSLFVDIAEMIGEDPGRFAGDLSVCTSARDQPGQVLRNICGP